MIDSYAQQYILKEEFEPRIKAMKQNLKNIQEQQNKLTEQKNLTRELKLIITNLEEFIGKIDMKLDHLDWHTQKDIIRQLVKRIEMGDKEMNIVYKINNLPDCEHHSNPQHCLNRTSGSGRTLLE